MNSLNGLSYISTNLSGLATGNFDEIVSNDITASTTYQKQIPIQNIIFLSGLNANLQDQINSIHSNGNSGAITDLQTILTGASWDGTYNFLNLTNNLHVYGVLFLGDPQIDVGYIISTLPSTYATIADLQANYVTYAAQTTEFNNRLANYVTNPSLATTLTNYETISDLQSNYVTYTAQTAEFNNRLANYVLNSNLTTTLSSYVTNSSLTTTLSSYVTNSSLTTTLSSYVTTSSLATTLSSYVTNSSLTTTLSSYETIADLSLNWVSKTFLTNQLGSYATNSTLSNYVTNSS